MLPFQRYIKDLFWMVEILKITQFFDSGHIAALPLLKSSMVENMQIDLEIVVLRF